MKRFYDDGDGDDDGEREVALDGGFYSQRGMSQPAV